MTNPDLDEEDYNQIKPIYKKTEGYTSRVMFSGIISLLTASIMGIKRIYTNYPLHTKIFIGSYILITSYNYNKLN